jgi:hypothetical protein
VVEGGTVYMTDSKDGAFRLTALNEKFPDQMKEAERKDLSGTLISERLYREVSI